MFNFFHRTKPVIVDCYTDNPNAYNLTPVVRSSKTMPNWFKELPNQNNKLMIKNDRANMTRCAGFIDLYSTGCVIESWCDLKVDVSEQGYKFNYSDGDKPDQHHHEQYGNGWPNYYHMKLTSPWQFDERSGIKFHFAPCTWSLDNQPFTILPGIVDFKHNTSTHINMMFPIQNYSFMIALGQPLLHIIPLTERAVEYRCHLVTTEELKKHKRYNLGFFGYKYIQKIMKRNEQRCPFH
jgi:hypothetical protein